MKQPVAPRKPFKPTLSEKPSQTITRVTTKTVKTLPSWGSFTLEDLKQWIREAGGDESQGLRVVTESTGDSYDYPDIVLQIEVLQNEPNPDYESQMKFWENEKVQLKKRLEKYVKDLEVYNEKKTKYDVAKQAYDEQARKNRIVRLEKELEGLKKK